MNLVKCRFLDENKKPKGKEYTYATNDSVAVGEIVGTQDGKDVIVTALDISQDSIAGLEDKLKYVFKIIDAEADSANTISFSETTDSTADTAECPVIAFELPEISVNKENLAIVEQLPIITEQLKVFSVEIDSIVSAVKLMECTDDNRKSIQKHRAKINALFTEFENRRKAIKNEILAPYEQFNEDYELYVADKIRGALKILDESINAIKEGVKQKLSDDAESYFYEYAASRNIDWLTWEKSGIKVGLSDNKTSLRREATSFIDRVKNDLSVIETLEHKDEITVEYHKDLSLAKAMSTVQVRVKAIAEQERIRAEQEERRKVQKEQRRLQAEAMEKARTEQKPAALGPPKQQVTPAVETPKTTQVEAKKYSVAFKIIDETIERMTTLKKILTDNGYEYEQIPLKNIIKREAV